MLKGCLSSMVAELEDESNLFWREINPSAKSCSSLKKLLEVYASREEWEQVVNLSSRAVLHLSKNYDRADFYHIWICALRETFDNKSLISLGKHLIKMRNFHPVFLSLALMAFHFSSCKHTSLKIFKYLRKLKNVENRFNFEACGLYLSNMRDKVSIKKGLFLLRKTCAEKNASYFSWRNYLRCLSENNLLEKMSETYNIIHNKFPFAQEPYLVASLIAMNEKNWNEAIRVLGQIVFDNPNNANATLAMAQCFYEMEDYISTISILSLKKYIFLENDYDYHYIMGTSIKKIIEKDFNSELQRISLVHLEKSFFLANSLGFPVEYIANEIENLNSLSLLINNENKENNSNIVLIHSENLNELESTYEQRKAG